MKLSKRVKEADGRFERKCVGREREKERSWKKERGKKLQVAMPTIQK